MRTVRLTLIVFAGAVAALAQFGGQYPRMPGQYPPGGGNPTGTGQPGGRPTRQDRNTKAPAVTVTTTGMLRTFTGTHFVLEADDHRIITYRNSSTTTITKDGKDQSIDKFQLGDRLVVDATQDNQGYYTAVSVKFEKAGTPADRAAAAETWDLPRLSGLPSSASGPSAPEREPGDDRPVLRRAKDDSEKEPAAPVETGTANPRPKAPAAREPVEEPLDTRPTTQMRPPDAPADPDDSGPPSLRRGAPAPRRATANTAARAGAGTSGDAPVILSKAPEPTAASAPVSLLTPVDDPVIAKAREVAESFAAGGLPNFFCQQMTTRYQSQHPKQGWDALDVVTADVAYEEGRESYKNIKVGNKAVNKRMEDIEGTRSTGEFASLELDLLNPATAAVFRPSGQDTIHGRSTLVYKYEVPRERSHWRIEATAELYYPAYQGKIWIDRQTSRVLRIEQGSRNMPLLFPFDTVETATDYDFVRLATSDPFLLPVDAEVLSCVRGTSTCSKNRIEFRNYRKFGAESNVTFDEKQP